MDSSPDRIAPAFKKPKDLQGSFHASDDDLGLFDLLADHEEENILAIATSKPMRAMSMPSVGRKRGVSKTCSFGSTNSASRRSARHESASTVASSASSVSSSSRSSCSSLRRTKSSSSKKRAPISLELQMNDLSL